MKQLRAQKWQSEEEKLTKPSKVKKKKKNAKRKRKTVAEMLK